jgi:hypothetical protein
MKIRTKVRAGASYDRCGGNTRCGGSTRCSGGGGGGSFYDTDQLSSY